MDESATGLVAAVPETGAAYNDDVEAGEPYDDVLETEETYSEVFEIGETYDVFDTEGAYDG